MIVFPGVEVLKMMLGEVFDRIGQVQCGVSLLTKFCQLTVFPISQRIQAPRHKTFEPNKNSGKNTTTGKIMEFTDKNSCLAMNVTVTIYIYKILELENLLVVMQILSLVKIFCEEFCNPLIT